MTPEVRFIEPEEFHLVDDFCDSQGIPRMNPLFSKVVVGMVEGRVVGIVASQMIIHAEPIWIDEEYRGGRLWLELAEAMDSYLEVMGAAGVYNQPTNPTAEKLVARMGYVKAEHPLWVKNYRAEPE